MAWEAVSLAAADAPVARAAKIKLIGSMMLLLLPFFVLRVKSIQSPLRSYGSAATNGIQEYFGFLSFQATMGTFILSSSEPTKTLSSILDQTLGNGTHLFAR